MSTLDKRITIDFGQVSLNTLYSTRNTRVYTTRSNGSDRVTIIFRDNLRLLLPTRTPYLCTETLQPLCMCTIT